MKVLEYDDVDPLQVLHLTMIALDFQFSPEHAAYICRTDPRPFPCFTVNAVENDMVLGQVGVFRLPVISTEGREDVEGIWAVSTHPGHARRAVASRLLDAAHARMQDGDLQFSTLGMNRYRTAYRLYQQHGYADMNVWPTALARWETAHQPTRIRAEPPGPEGFDFIEMLFEKIASDYLGFAWRYMPFASLRDRVSLENIWILWENTEPVGYVFAHKDSSVLQLDLQLLRPDVDAAETVAAAASKCKTSYGQVSISRPAEIASLQRAGYQIAHPNWEAFMVKPLIPDVTAEDARRLFGIGTDWFLISWLDTTGEPYMPRKKGLS